MSLYFLLAAIWQFIKITFQESSDHGFELEQLAHILEDVLLDYILVVESDTSVIF